MENELQILLVEDNPGDITLTREAFDEGKLHHRLHVVMDGVEALRYLRREGEYTESPTPDLILLDLNLPKRDGRQVLEDIKRDPVLREIPVIVLTTSDDEADVHRAYGLHANCYLTKPVDMDEFLHVVRSLEEFWLTLVRLPRRRNTDRG